MTSLQLDPCLVPLPPGPLHLQPRAGTEANPLHFAARITPGMLSNNKDFVLHIHHVDIGGVLFLT